MYQRLDVTLAPDLLRQCQRLIDSIDITPGVDGSCSSDPTVTRGLFEPVLKEVVPWRWASVMLMALSPGCVIPGHTDGYTLAQRYHLPLVSNDRCWVFHDKTWEQLEVGGLYTMDPRVLHGAVNWGATMRVHVIVDR